MSVTSDSTVSFNWRKQGNESYQAAIRLGLSPSIKEERLKKAIHAYDRALNTTDIHHNDYCSAAKNCAMAYWKMAELKYCKDDSQSLIEHYYELAISHFDKALLSGLRQKGLEWIEALVAQFVSCVFEAVHNVIEKQPNVDRCVTNIEKLIRGINEGNDFMREVKSGCFTKMAGLLFNKSVTQIENKKYKECMSTVRDCYYPLQEARRLNKHDMEELDELDRDIIIIQHAAESIQARKIGDEILRISLEDDDEMNVDMIWEVVDYYRQAIILTREKQVELEAIALSRLGSLYHKVLKMKDRAKESFMRCNQLAHSLSPRTFNTDEWFVDCKLILAEYQRQKVSEEEKSKSDARVKYKDAIKPDLDLLESKANEGTEALLVYLYKTYPPKKKNATLPDMKKMKEKGGPKKILTTALLHYHPDKQEVDDDDEEKMKWKVFAEEITKILNQKFELFKGND